MMPYGTTKSVATVEHLQFTHDSLVETATGGVRSQSELNCEWLSTVEYRNLHIEGAPDIDRVF